MIATTTELEFQDAFDQWRADNFNEHDETKASEACSRLCEVRAFKRYDWDVIRREMPKIAHLFFNGQKLEHEIHKRSLAALRKAIDAAHEMRTALRSIGDPLWSLVQMRLNSNSASFGGKEFNLDHAPDMLRVFCSSSNPLWQSLDAEWQKAASRPPLRSDVRNTVPRAMHLWKTAAGKGSFSGGYGNGASHDRDKGNPEYESPGPLFVQKILQSFDPTVTIANVKTAIESAKKTIG